VNGLWGVVLEGFCFDGYIYMLFCHTLVLVNIYMIKDKRWLRTSSLLLKLLIVL
jgi:hypothetical protein